MKHFTVLGVALAAIGHMHAASAQGAPGAFSDGFYEDAVLHSEMAGLWNSAFDRCKSEGKPASECVIGRETDAVPHGHEMTPFCASVSDRIRRHYCVVVGSIAADLIAKFNIESAEGFIRAHGPDGEDAVDSAGSAIWSYLDNKCSQAASPTNCIHEEISKRLQPSASDMAGCNSLVGAHTQSDCLMARWVVAKVREVKDRL